MRRRPPRSTQGVSSAASDVYKRQDKDIFDPLFSKSLAPERCIASDMSKHVSLSRPKGTKSKPKKMGCGGPIFSRDEELEECLSPDMHTDNMLFDAHEKRHEKMPHEAQRVDLMSSGKSEPSLLSQIIIAQQINGCWNLSDLAVIFKFPDLLKNVPKEIEEIHLSTSLEATQIWATIISLCYLSHKFQDKKASWELVALKGTKFLSKYEINLQNLNTKAMEIITSSNLQFYICLLYTSPSPRDLSTSRMPSSA
eukprot:TRINITY_DN28173_c0_g1_i1.p1 TRINITY_DN28173_c0_g1~~TRINITY_DN28173_c0_g1_i1.p1  ORF type:complete len:253 (-),score=39.57 TRINITY_DN28173_c0_g1_i1:146-904(-)